MVLKTKEMNGMLTIALKEKINYNIQNQNSLLVEQLVQGFKIILNKEMKTGFLEFQL